MPKIRYPNPSRHSSNMDIVNVGREKLYLLSAALAASRYLAKDCVFFIPGCGRNAEDDAFAELRGLLDDFEGKHVTSLLIETAAISRIRHKDIENEMGKRYEYPTSVHVGKIRNGVEVYQPMSLKDAWDKVIHAETVHFDYRIPKYEHHRRYITNSVELKGEYRREPWTVVIDLRKYIRHSAVALR